LSDYFSWKRHVVHLLDQLLQSRVDWLALVLDALRCPIVLDLLITSCVCANRVTTSFRLIIDWLHWLMCLCVVKLFILSETLGEWHRSSILSLFLFRFLLRRDLRCLILGCSSWVFSLFRHVDRMDHLDLILIDLVAQFLSGSFYRIWLRLHLKCNLCLDLGLCHVWNLRCCLPPLRRCVWLLNCLGASCRVFWAGTRLRFRLLRIIPSKIAHVRRLHLSWH
jgi:hypothetical protein